MKNNLNFNSDNNNSDKKSPFNFYWIYGAIIVAAIVVNYLYTSTPKTSVKLQTFYTLADSSFVHDVALVNRSRVDFRLSEEGVSFIKAHKDQYKSLNEALENGKRTNPKGDQKFEIQIPDATSFVSTVEKINEKNKAEGKPAIDVKPVEEIDYFRSIINFLLPILALVLIWVFIMRRAMGGRGGAGGQIFNIGKSRAQVYEKGKSTNVTFNDVAGLRGAKEEIQEIVDFLKNSSKYTELGAKIPKGALLVGPPGTGKTLLAKAVAGEAKVPFFSLSGSDFVEMFVGVGASRVRDLFRQAKEKAPAIIFIDEIDAIGRARGKHNGFGSNDERENTLNQLLTEMDGFGTNTGVIILAATNRADVLDNALMRAGRFDRQIYVDMPDLVERKEIFKVHIRPLKMDDSVDLDFLAKQTPGFSGADIANLCNEAALIAARKQKKAVSQTDFLDAVDRIIGGLEKKDKIITPDEKKSIAFHESGHATVSWLLEYAHPLVKVTIVPRGKSLGAAWYLPEERQITTTEQLLDDMCAALGGRAAEQLIFGRISTGALSDLEKVTKQAYAMVTIYGLNSRIGNISYYDSQGRDSFTKPYSEDTAKAIDEEVSKIIEEQYQRALKILSENKDKLTALANKLIEHEVIFRDDLVKIFGKRQWEIADEANDERKSSVSESEGIAGETEPKAIDATPTTTPETPTSDQPQNDSPQAEKPDENQPN